MIDFTDRINELAYVCRNRYEEHGIDLEKFAELIIKECTDVCYDTSYRTGEGYAELINERFGIKDE